MRAVMCEAFGPPETLVYKEVADPEPGKGQVRIAIEAVGVNFPDTLIIEDKYQFKPQLPFAPGGEVAGTIDAVGEGVSAERVGEKVMAMTLHGGFAEKIVVDEKALLKRPKDMPGHIAAAFTMTYGTSMHALKQRGQLQPGETLLVLGAGGGVGLAAVEIGKQMGATVIAAASTAEKLAVAKAGGADHLINYTEEDMRGRIKEITSGKGVDVFYDPVGGDLFEQALRSTGWGGRALVIGFAGGDIPKIPVNIPLLKGSAIVGVFWGAFRLRDVETDNANFDELFAWYEAGKLKPHVTQTYPLEEAATALNVLKNRQAIGKVVVTIK